MAESVFSDEGVPSQRLFGRIIVFNKERHPWLLIRMVERLYSVGSDQNSAVRIKRPEVHKVHCRVEVSCDCNEVAAGSCRCDASAVRVYLRNLVPKLSHATRHNGRPMLGDLHYLELTHGDEFSVSQRAFRFERAEGSATTARREQVRSEKLQKLRASHSSLGIGTSVSNSTLQLTHDALANPGKRALGPEERELSDQGERAKKRARSDGEYQDTFASDSDRDRRRLVEAISVHTLDDAFSAPESSLQHEIVSPPASFREVVSPTFLPVLEKDDENLLESERSVASHIVLCVPRINEAVAQRAIDMGMDVTDKIEEVPSKMRDMNLKKRIGIFVQVTKSKTASVPQYYALASCGLSLTWEWLADSVRHGAPLFPLPRKRHQPDYRHPLNTTVLKYLGKRGHAVPKQVIPVHILRFWQTGEIPEVVPEMDLSVPLTGTVVFLPGANSRAEFRKWKLVYNQMGATIRCCCTVQDTTQSIAAPDDLHNCCDRMAEILDLDAAKQRRHVQHLLMQTPIGSGGSFVVADCSPKFADRKLRSHMDIWKELAPTTTSLARVLVQHPYPFWGSMLLRVRNSGTIFTDTCLPDILARYLAERILSCQDSSELVEAASLLVKFVGLSRASRAPVTRSSFPLYEVLARMLKASQTISALYCACLEIAPEFAKGVLSLMWSAIFREEDVPAIREQVALMPPVPSRGSTAVVPNRHSQDQTGIETKVEIEFVLDRNAIHARIWRRKDADQEVVVHKLERHLDLKVRGAGDVILLKIESGECFVVEPGNPFVVRSFDSAASSEVLCAFANDVLLRAS